MKKAFFIFSLCFLFTSCGEEDVQFTMPEDDLVKLLYDIQVAEAALQTVHSNIKDSVVAIYYEQVFEIHGTTKEILVKNIEVLKEKPIKSHEIYKKVLEYHKEATKRKK